MIKYDKTKFTHTFTLLWWQNTIEDMTLEAIQKGFTILGFSGHGNCREIDDYSMTDDNTQKYIQDVLEVKEKYKDQIHIF